MSNIQKNEELYKMTKDELTMATVKGSAQLIQTGDNHGGKLVVG